MTFILILCLGNAEFYMREIGLHWGKLMLVESSRGVVGYQSRGPVGQ